MTMVPEKKKTAIEIGSSSFWNSLKGIFANSYQVTDKTTQPIRVLHVEDDPTIAGLMQEISEHEGWDVEHCIDGTTALKALASDTDYDVL